MRDPYAALRYPEFRRLTFATFLITAAILVQEVVLGYEVYLMTRDPLALGLVGLAEAIPFIALALFGGHLADRRERLLLMRWSLGTIMLGSVGLAVLMHPDVRARLSTATQLAAIYGTVFLLGLARGIYSPAASSLKAFLVPRELYPNSSAWISSFWQAGAVMGPAGAGYFYAHFGLSSTLALVAAAFAVAMALLPIYAEDILAVGPEGLGFLRAAPALGALLVMFLCAYYPPTDKAWRNLLWAVVGFGVATLVFAVSESFALSLVMLFFTGATDSISVIIRQTLLQALPPDHLRGRVVSVNSIFVTTSNELGAFESGVAAKLMGVVPSVIFGGVMTLATVGYIWRRSKDLLTQRLL